MTVVNNGLAEIANLLIGSGTAFTHVAIGTGTTAENATQTALVTETNREAAAVSRVTTTISNDTSQWISTFTFSTSRAIREYGVFNHNSAGTMLLRKLDDVINVENGDSLQVTIKLKNARP